MTKSERDPAREKYTWSGFKVERQQSEGPPRPVWQNDKLWAAILVSCAVGMCLYFR
ncbi:MAG: hypothetical protein U0903_04680 [Planctomycetales bacterium]